MKIFFRVTVGLFFSLSFLAMGANPTHADERCGPGRVFSRSVAGCIQETCPAPSHRNYTDICQCDESENGGPARHDCRDATGLLTHCAEANQSCDGTGTTTGATPPSAPATTTAPEQTPIPAPPVQTEEAIQCAEHATLLATLEDKQDRIDRLSRVLAANTHAAAQYSRVYDRALPNGQISFPALRARAERFGAIVKPIEERSRERAQRIQDGKNNITTNACIAAGILFDNAASNLDDDLNAVSDAVCAFEAKSTIIKESNNRATVTVEWPQFIEGQTCDCARFDYQIIYERQSTKFGWTFAPERTVMQTISGCEAKVFDGEAVPVGGALTNIGVGGWTGRTGIAGFGSRYRVFGEVIPKN